MTSVHPGHLANESAPEDASDIIVQKEVKQTWLSYVWDTFDKSPEERRLLFKLDTAILTFASLGTVLFSAANCTLAISSADSTF
jgi:hypothetical protein